MHRDGDSPNRGFRPDIEGLRALALGAVLLCHAGLPLAAGGYVGVDVFFVISGFLITRLLLAELEGTGGVSLANFFARRAKRLLPSLAVVLLAVVALSFLLLTPVRAVEVSGDVTSSAFYVVNWHFASQSVNYFAQGGEPSPVQHIWSLAVEEQFYIVWPLLILGVALLCLRLRSAPLRAVLWPTLAAVALISFALGVWLTESQPRAAYFSTFGRAWELALGAMLAALGPLRLRAGAAAAIGWLGAAAIVAAVLLFDAGTPFPGFAALLPTLGAAALILAGSAELRARSAAPARVLALRPVRYMGRISYVWYLWHWPAVVFATAIWGPLGLAAGLAVTAASIVPSILTHHLVERPLHHSRLLAVRPRRALALGATCTVVGAVAGLTLLNLQPNLAAAPVAEVEGARALPRQPSPQRFAKAVRPSPMDAREDRSRMFEDGCLVGMKGTHSNRCEYGDTSSRRTVYLFGDSHAMQYFPAIEKLAGKRGWRLVALAKSECTPAAVEVLSETTGRRYDQCPVWRERALRRIEAGRKGDLVLMSGASQYVPLDADGEEIEAEERAETLEEGYVATLRRIHAAGLRTAVIKDPPAAEDDVPSCVSARLHELDRCAFPRVRGEAQEFDARAAERAPGTRLVDLTDQICPRDVCRAVIGDALVYRDKSHLSATFAVTLAPSLERGLREAGLL